MILSDRDKTTLAPGYRPNMVQSLRLDGRVFKTIGHTFHLPIWAIRLNGDKNLTLVYERMESRDADFMALQQLVNAKSPA